MERGATSPEKKMKYYTNKDIFTEMKKDDENPDQENYQELVFLRIKNLLLEEFLTPHQIMKIKTYSSYFCKNIKRISRQHRGKITSKILDTHHTTFLNKLINVNTFECFCQDCKGNIIYY